MDEYLKKKLESDADMIYMTVAECRALQELLIEKGLITQIELKEKQDKLKELYGKSGLGFYF